MFSDVEFTLNSGDYKGDTYRYTLASNNGAKMWSVNPVNNPPPCMYKRKIDMTIFAGEQNAGSGGAISLRKVEDVLTEIERIMEATEPTTLKAFGGKDRIIKVTENGYQVETVMKEDKRQPEYHIKLTCWEMYKYGNYE